MVEPGIEREGSGLHGMAYRLETELARRAHNLVSMPVIRNHAEPKAQGLRSIEPRGNLVWCGRAIARHECVITVKQDSALALSEKLFKVDTVDRCYITRG